MSDKVNDFLAQRFGIIPDENTFLAHYASKYYDPVKAKEYYERTKELKGRKKSLTSDNQRQAWNYAQNQIQTKRDAEKKANQNAGKAAKEAAAKAQKERLEKLQKDAEAMQTRIIEAVQKRLAEINKETPIPLNASPKVRAFLAEQNAKRRASATKAAKGELQKLGQDLRGALQKARESYQGVQSGLSKKYSESGKAIDAKYKKAKETEYENIRTKVK